MPAPNKESAKHESSTLFQKFCGKTVLYAENIIMKSPMRKESAKHDSSSPFQKFCGKIELYAENINYILRPLFMLRTLFYAGVS